jgi:hypothetical protein
LRIADFRLFEICNIAQRRLGEKNSDKSAQVAGSWAFWLEIGKLWHANSNPGEDTITSIRQAKQAKSAGLEAKKARRILIDIAHEKSDFPCEIFTEICLTGGG